MALFAATMLTKEQFRETITSLGWPWAWGGVGLYFIAQTGLASRWVLLLRVHSVSISLFQAIKLTYLGLFYNNMMPGAVGGDLLKGWYITHHSDRHLRLEAAVTVFVDRLVGLIGMILVGALASLFIGPEVRFRGFQIRWLVWAMFVVMVLVAIVFLSRRIRRALMLNHLLDRLPLARRLKQIDQAIRIYRLHIPTMVTALAMTALLQGLAVVAVWMLTRAMGLVDVSFLQCLIVMPIIWVISAAVPVPGGWGVLELCITYLFSLVIMPEAPNSDDARGYAGALALLYRVMICFCSLPGALVPLFGGHLPKVGEMEEEMENDEMEVQE